MSFRCYLVCRRGVLIFGDFRWRDRGRDDNSPPPPYEESERSHQQTHDPKSPPTQLNPEPTQTNGRSPRRRHAATAGRRVAGNSARHRKPIPQRFHATAYSQPVSPSQPVQVQDIPSGPFDFSFGQVEGEGEGEDEGDDQVRRRFRASSFPAQLRCMRVVLIDGHPTFVDGLDRR